MMGLIASLAFLVWLITISSAGASVTPTKSTDDPQSYSDEAEIEAKGHFRGIRPTGYSVKVDITGPVVPGQDMPFSGFATMTFEVVVANISKVYFHALDLDISTVALNSDSGKKIWGLLNLQQEDSNYIWSVTAPFAFELGGEYKLGFHYSGFVGNATRGIFYHFSPGNSAADDSWIVSTLLKMRSAREAFPCIDHPLLKATFNVCVAYYNQDGPPLSDITIAGSTTPLFSKIDENSGRMESCFQETPIMPTSVVAFAIMKNFVKRSVTENGTVPVIVYHLPNQSLPPESDLGEQANLYAQIILKETGPMIRRMEEYFDMKFPLDQVAFILHPARPSGGYVGIENMGLIGLGSWIPGYYRHRMFAHELIHHWVGNSATLSSWSELCVQEGLTSSLDGLFSEFIGVDKKDIIVNAGRPSYLRRSNGAESFDGIVKPYPTIEAVVSNCYSRPPTIFSTIRELGGDDKFREFVVELIRQHKDYDNYNFNSVNDLIDRKISSDAATFFNTMFTTEAYPVLIVSMNNYTDAVDVEGRWLFYGDPEISVPFPKLPVKLVSSALPDQPTEGLRVPFSLDIPALNASDWVAINTRNMMYRVIYDLELYKRLAQPCNGTESKCLDADSIGDAFVDLSWALQTCFVPWFCDGNAKGVLKSLRSGLYEGFMARETEFTAKRWALAVGEDPPFHEEQFR